MSREVLDLFAGPGGWDVGARGLGLEPLGVELDTDACATREAAGLRTLQADVAALDPHTFAPVEGLIASPPCQSFSTAGKGGGLVDTPLVDRCLHDLAAGRDTRGELVARMEDRRSLLVVEPLRFALALRPEWVALEQVPGVLPLWETLAELLRAEGYGAWCGILNSADYGVPQTRRRAILIARRGEKVAPPEPTHADPATGLSMFAAPWVSMAEALGWCDTDLVGFPRRADAPSSEPGAHTVTIDGTDYRARDLRNAALPAFNLTEKARSWRRIVYDRRPGPGQRVNPRPADQPAPTLTAEGMAHGVHVWRYRNDCRTNATERSLYDHAPTVTVGNAAAQHFVAPDGETVRVLLQEASVLQGFPHDHPWQGSRSSAFRQVGNAIPPPLAQAVLAAVVGAKVTP